jgi:hypothetical protein
MAGRADAGAVPPVLRVDQRTQTRPEGRVMPLMCRAGAEIPGDIGHGVFLGIDSQGRKGEGHWGGAGAAARIASGIASSGPRYRSD